jgi:hypothetical protein
MGIQKNVGLQEFPKQGTMLGKKVKVCFRYDLNNQVDGEVVRDDREEPFETIIRLQDGRFVRAVECMYSAG